MWIRITTIPSVEFGQRTYDIDADIEWLGQQIEKGFDQKFLWIADKNGDLALVIPTNSLISIKPIVEIKVNATQN